MNKFVAVVLCASFLVLTTGCEGLFNTVKKDAVLVKKISQEHKMSEVKYEGVLAQDTVKTLSLNAVNKTFNEKLRMEEARFELMAVDRKKLEDLLNKTEYGVRPLLEQNQKLKMNSETELNKVPGGLFYVTLTRAADPDEVYELVLNARDGEVLKVSSDISKPAPIEKEPSVIHDGGIEIANRFIQEKGAYALADLIPEEKTARQGVVGEVYYKSKENESLVYSVKVNLRTQQVVGFSKDIMAILGYFSDS
ncbi:hypothetical protein [Paenibacillus chitinolyticus]|uniref:hypothetical protein n=1 Tax=Paenibacillus chitinolyticus TaxID=79263 RepID=UPI00364FE616